MNLGSMKKYIGLVLLVLIFSCKAKKVVAKSNATETAITSEQIINNHYNNKKEFTTLNIRSSVKYSDDKQSQNVTADIRIKKNEIILVSIRFIGITMAKAMITPDKVRYYEKLGGKYFEGDFSMLSQWLGTDLDFNKVQNLFIGQALDDLKKEKYSNIIEDKMYKLDNISDKLNQKTFYFESDKFLVKKQEIAQTEKQRMLQILYPEFREYPQGILPNSIKIDAAQELRRTNINIDYSSVLFNEELTFPYAVPEGYERIYIK
jgi:Domain of unknown function (DUF4292)